MEIAGLIIWAIGFFAAQIVAFVAFVLRMNIKLEKMKSENERDYAGMRLQITELQTDIEDHKLAYEKRFSDFYKILHDDNNNAHDSIMREIASIKELVSEIRETVGYLKGALATHIANGNPHAKPRTRG